MKTNVTMESRKDRELFGVTIRQDTKNSFMSLTDLQEAYTYARVQNGWSDRRVAEILSNIQTHERIYYLLETQGLIKTGFPAFMQLVATQGIVTTLKELGAYRTTGRGESKTVMCDPYIWVLVAMELNPMLYARVVMWLTDKLILNRIEAGDFHVKLSDALKTLSDVRYGVDYAIVGKNLNIAIFGRHEVGIRNTGSEEELSSLTRLQENLAFAIDNKYITDMDGVLKAISRYGKQRKALQIST